MVMAPLATSESGPLQRLLTSVRMAACVQDMSLKAFVSMQADNPQREAIFPVGFLAPAPGTALGLGMLPEAALPSSSASKAPALCVRVAVWQRRPAGVLCFERIEVCPLYYSRAVCRANSMPFYKAALSFLRGCCTGGRTVYA
jgi:hypothetical protein